ncbi:MAG TPA: capsular polysaccharide synthesis protein [Euzebyales bacterium]|nr:capsular polysaccharide synthesis protein [Euzebyales bacterium]
MLRRLGDTDGVAHVTATMRECEPGMSPVEQRLLAADPEHFEARRYLVAFVTAHLDEIHERAVHAQPASAEAPYRVWVYWGQGMAEAPPVVRRCHMELIRHHGADEVVVLDDDAIDRYADIPGYVHDRTRNSRTKFSDVLRLDLLARHGGVWLDATCLVRENMIAMLPDLLSSGFFAPRYRTARISSWFMASPPGHRVIEALRWAQIIYWRHHDRPIDYYVLHHLFEALSHLHPEVTACCQNMPWMSSQRLTRFKDRMLKPYDADRFRTLLDVAPVHKLTYKISPEVDTGGTMLDHLLRTGAPH